MTTTALRRPRIGSLVLALAVALGGGCPGEEEDPAPDADGDGYDQNDDCDDHDADTYPGAEELCDGVDNDCDALVPPEEIDDDHDGLAECEGDCDDTDAAVNPGAEEVCDGIDNDCDGEADGADATGAQVYYADGDGDGFGDPEVGTMACDAPSGYTEDDTDCDDQDGDVYPDAPETCNGIDDDCDGLTDEEGAVDAPEWHLDGDGDGFGDPDATVHACSQPGGYVDDTEDCDDGDATIHPGAEEVCDGVDNDCDGVIDGEDATDATAWYGDDDGDGYGDYADGVTACDAPSGHVAIGGDCNDTDAAIHPGAEEWCETGLDEDCDGSIDEGCVDHCGNIATDAVWQAGVTHVVSCDIYVQGGSAPELTVQDGATVRFAAGVDLYVAYSNFGSIHVDGGGQGVLFGSLEQTPAPGDWGGLYLGDFDSGSLLEGLTLEYGGGNGSGAIWASGASPELTGCTVRSSSEHGLYAVAGSFPRIQDSSFLDNAGDGVYLGTSDGLDATGPPSFSGNTLTGNGGHPMTLAAPAVGELDAGTSTFSGNGSDMVRVHPSSVTADATWQAIDVPLRIDGDLYVQGGGSPRLTIEDGATLAFDPSTDLYVGYNNYGSLEVQGGATGVVFTAADPSPQPGDWNGVFLGTYDSGSQLNGLTVEYAGGNGHGAIWASNADPQLQGCTVRESSHHGLYADAGAVVRIATSTFADNAEDGVRVSAGAALDDDGPPSFAGNALTGNGGYPVSLPAPSVAEVDGTTAISGNAADVVRVLTGTVSADATWQAQAVPYLVDGDVYVQGNGVPVLTIADGAELWFASGVDLYVALGAPGGLEVQGSSLGVLLTAADPTPQPGAWNGIFLGAFCVPGDTVIDGAVIEYGGGNGGGNLLFSSCSGSVIDSTIAYSSSYGVYTEGNASPALTNVTYLGNTLGNTN